MYPLRVTGNINSITPPIGPKHSTSALSLILPHISKKSLTIKVFLNPFRYKVSKLLPAIPHTRHGAFEEKDQPAVLSSIHIPILDRV